MELNIENARSTFGPRVELGMKVLDEKYPGWLFLINLDDLNQSSVTRCVLGQLFGTYFKYIHHQLGAGEVAPCNDWFWEHGFAVGPAEVNRGFLYLTLTDVWKEKIQAAIVAHNETLKKKES